MPFDPTSAWRLTSVRRPATGHDRTSGVAAVEAAIVLPVVIALFVGIVEFGLIFKDSLAISAGVRAGGRIASADPANPRLVRDTADEVARSLSAVSLASSPVPRLYVYDPDRATPPGDCRSSCILLTYGGGAFTRVSGSWDPCAAPASRDAAVLLTVRHQSVTRAGFASPTLTEKADFAFVPSSSPVC